MTSTRGKWLRSSLTALAILVAPAGTSTVRAQRGGFGADPFRPYNNQYDVYTYPMAGPDVAPGGGLPRAGNRGANQYQDYLDELSGSTRQGSERYGIGMPYFRSSVDPTFDPKGNREYRPNNKSDRTYEQTQEVITRKYLAYFGEKDPKKRAALLKDYNRTRSSVSRAMSGRREDTTRALEAATADDLAEDRSPSPARRVDSGSGTAADGRPRSSTARRSTRAPGTGAGTRITSDVIPPPPPLLPGSSARRRRPSEVLDRSRRLNSTSDVEADDSGARTGAGSAAARRPPPSDAPPE